MRVFNFLFPSLAPDGDVFFEKDDDGTNRLGSSSPLKEREVVSLYDPEGASFESSPAPGEDEALEKEFESPMRRFSPSPPVGDFVNDLLKDWVIFCPSPTLLFDEGDLSGDPKLREVGEIGGEEFVRALGEIGDPGKPFSFAMEVWSSSIFRDLFLGDVC